MKTFAYDTAVDPAIPICSVTISTTEAGRGVALDAIIDTGADATIIPTRFLRRIGARRVFETGLRSQWGERRSVFLYLVDLAINDIVLPGIYVVGDEAGDEVVLGRNVLNKLVMNLDGPKQVAAINI